MTNFKVGDLVRSTRYTPSDIGYIIEADRYHSVDIYVVAWNSQENKTGSLCYGRHLENALLTEIILLITL